MYGVMGQMPWNIMDGRKAIDGILRSYDGNSSLLSYAESDDEIRFDLPTPIRDTQTAACRCRAAVLNELAVSHRLSLLLGRAVCGLPEECTFAIRSVESALHGIDPVEVYRVSLRFEVIAKRHDAITALRSILVTQYGVAARRTVTSFNLLPPSLARFVRRGRKFLDFADVRIGRDKAYLSTVAENHFRYYPAEGDRLSDGRRVDHVPALSLIDIALSVNEGARHGTDHQDLSAEFLNYTDPRFPFDVLRKKEHSAIEFVQDGQVVAIVYDRESSR
jgi:hypothetical protein